VKVYFNFSHNSSSRLKTECARLNCLPGPIGQPGVPGEDGMPGALGLFGKPGNDGYDFEQGPLPPLPCVVCPAGLYSTRNFGYHFYNF